jgi:hypothetical protein
LLCPAELLRIIRMRVRIESPITGTTGGDVV